MKKNAAGGIFLIIFILTGAMSLSAKPVFWFDLESGAAFTGYNNVQIPADTGTRVSLADDLESTPAWFYRLQLGADLGRHSIFLLYAPLTVKSNGTAVGDIDFYGTTFPDGTPLEGTYIFNSYRLTWSYTIADTNRFRFAAGVTGKIRDASIGLKSSIDETSRVNLGVVPLIHLELAWRFLPRMSFILNGDGLAVPQGRAEDFLVALQFSPQPDLDLKIGYRVLEGGSDGGGSVYTFSLFHYISAGVRYRF